MTDLEKVLGKTGARKFWDKVLGNVKILTGDVAYNTKGDLQTQINAVADTASTAKTTADAAKTAAEDAKVAAGEIVTDTTDKFDSTKDYAVGDYVIYDNKAWKFTTVHPAGAWDESHVEQTNILAEIAAQNKNFGGISFGIDGDGNYGYYGADGSLIPFKTFNCNVLYKSNSEVNSTTTYKSDKHRTILLFANAVGGTGYYPSYSITSDKSNITKIAEYYVAYGGTEFSSKSVLYKIDLEEGESVNVRLYYRGTFIILG